MTANNDQKAQLEAYEEQNVHDVYQQIAQHFSSTRYKVRLLLVTPIAYLQRLGVIDSLSCLSAVAYRRTLPSEFVARRCRA